MKEEKETAFSSVLITKQYFCILYRSKEVKLQIPQIMTREQSPCLSKKSELKITKHTNVQIEHVILKLLHKTGNITSGTSLNSVDKGSVAKP